LIFEKKLWRGSLEISYEKYVKDGKVLAQFWLKVILKTRAIPKT
jgi:hypothetical protein